MYSRIRIAVIPEGKLFLYYLEVDGVRQRKICREDVLAEIEKIACWLQEPDGTYSIYHQWLKVDLTEKEALWFIAQASGAMTLSP